MALNRSDCIFIIPTNVDIQFQIFQWLSEYLEYRAVCPAATGRESNVSNAKPESQAATFLGDNRRLPLNHSRADTGGSEDRIPKFVLRTSAVPWPFIFAPKWRIGERIAAFSEIHGLGLSP